MATPRKNTKLAKRRRVLKSVDESRAFYLQNGKKLTSLLEFAKELERMDDNLFRNHVNSDRNDFSKWIEDVFGERKLSRRLNEVSDKTDAQITVLKHLVGGLS